MTIIGTSINEVRIQSLRDSIKVEWFCSLREKWIEQTYRHPTRYSLRFLRNYWGMKRKKKVIMYGSN